MYDETTIQPQFSPPPGAYQPPSTGEQERRSKAPFVLAGVAVVLLMVLLGALVLLAHRGDPGLRTNAAAATAISHGTAAPSTTPPSTDTNQTDDSGNTDDPSTTVPAGDQGGTADPVTESGGSGASTATSAPATTTPKTKTTTTAPSAPPTTKPATPPTTKPAPAKPTVLSVSAPAVYACSEAPDFTDPRMETVKWTTANAKSVSIAIDNPTGISYANLPANGQMDLSAPCKGDTQTFYIIATGFDGSTTTKSATTKGI